MVNIGLIYPASKIPLLFSKYKWLYMTYQKHTITNINPFQTLCLSPYRTLPLKLRPLALVRNRKYSYIKNILTFFIEFWGRRLTFLKSIRKFYLSPYFDSIHSILSKSSVHIFHLIKSQLSQSLYYNRIWNTYLSK